jgi:hypothetical protein
MSVMRLRFLAAVVLLCRQIRRLQACSVGGVGLCGTFGEAVARFFWLLYSSAFSGGRCMSYVVPLLCERVVLFRRIPIDVGGDGLLFRSAVVTAADLSPL